MFFRNAYLRLLSKDDCNTQLTCASQDYRFASNRYVSCTNITNHSSVHIRKFGFIVLVLRPRSDHGNVTLEDFLEYYLTKKWRRSLWQR